MPQPDELSDEAQRAELVSQLAAAQSALENAIAEIARNGSAGTNLGPAQLQLSALVSLRQHVGFASGAALAALRMEVVAAASSATAVAQQAASEISAVPGDPLTRAEAARRTIETVGREIFDERVLDPYLKFTSKEDEDAFRKRERERKEAFDRAMASGTPEGYCLAQQIQQGQLDDAAAHGAGDNPVFAKLKEQTKQAREDLASSAGVDRQHLGTVDTTGKKQENLDDVMASLRAAGVVNPTGSTAPTTGHGLAHAVGGRPDVTARGPSSLG